MTYKFSELMRTISQAAVPKWLAEHVFAHKDEMAAALQERKLYQFKGPIGEEITIRWEDV